jgi:beta-glucanase (GH16 family)
MSASRCCSVLTGLLLALAMTNAAPGAEPTPVGGPAGKAFTFVPLLSDEFSGTPYPVEHEGGVDATKWAKTMAGWSSGGHWPAYYMAGNTQVAGGAAQVILKEGGLPVWKPTDPANGPYLYSTGVLLSRYTSCYGYYEARLKTANVSADSAFWLAMSAAAQPTEIDIIENYGILSPMVGYLTAHYWDQAGSLHSQGQTWISPDYLTAGYHVYGLYWSLSQIVWYVDGVQRFQVANTAWHDPLHVLFDVSTNVSVCGAPLPSDMPAAMSVDYFRYWVEGTADPWAVPEPSSLILLAAGALALGARACAKRMRGRRRKSLLSKPPPAA